LQIREEMEFLSCLLLCVPACYIARKRKSWFGWDYATILGPLPFWYVLARIGPQSRSKLIQKLIQLAIVAAFVPLAVWTRVFAVGRFRRNRRVHL
jgi:hypothetical protein